MEEESVEYWQKNSTATLTYIVIVGLIFLVLLLGTIYLIIKRLTTIELIPPNMNAKDLTPEVIKDAIKNKNYTLQDIQLLKWYLENVPRANVSGGQLSIRTIPTGPPVPSYQGAYVQPSTQKRKTEPDCQEIKKEVQVSSDTVSYAASNMSGKGSTNTKMVMCGNFIADIPAPSSILESGIESEVPDNSAIEPSNIPSAVASDAPSGISKAIAHPTK